MNTDIASQEDKTLALLTHLGGIFFSFIPALVVWLVKKDSSAFLAAQAKEALNFQITILIGYAIAYVLMFILIGFLMFWIVAVANLVLCIVAGIKANEGHAYRYPFAVRLIQ